VKFRLNQKAWTVHKPQRYIAIYTIRTIQIILLGLLACCSSSEQIDETIQLVGNSTDKINTESNSIKYLGSHLLVCGDSFSDAYGAIRAEDAPDSALLWYPAGKASQKAAWCFPQGTL